VNEAHLRLCSSREWAEHIQTEVLPWALQAADPPGDLLEIGPGPGAATGLLRERVRHLTAVENDPRLAAELGRRFAGDPGVDVHVADATALPFPGGYFDGAASFTMLHHVPSAALQDRLFAEAARVLRPGGVLLGTDSLDGPGFRRLHEDDTCVPLDPLTLEERLLAAGFARASIAVLSIGVRFAAWTPGPAQT
jgi:SAM-dependent methyltransferase